MLDRRKLAYLAELLGATYPADHEIVLMSIRPNGLCSQSKTNPVGLEEAVMAFGSTATIFLPAIRTPLRAPEADRLNRATSRREVAC